MGLFGKLFGNAGAEKKNSMQEQALSAIDQINAQIMALEQNPDIPEEEKADKIRLLKHELKRFAESMGWEYNE